MAGASLPRIVLVIDAGTAAATRDAFRRFVDAAARVGEVAHTGHHADLLRTHIASLGKDVTAAIAELTRHSAAVFAAFVIPEQLRIAEALAPFEQQHQPPDTAAILRELLRELQRELAAVSSIRGRHSISNAELRQRRADMSRASARPNGVVLHGFASRAAPRQRRGRWRA